MKGISLPINMIVIVAIAVLVLVVTAGFFGGFFTSNIGTIQFEQAFNNACNQLRSLYNCDASKIRSVLVQYQPPGKTDPGSYSLARLCNQKLGTGRSVEQDFSGTDTICAQSCGCAV